MKYINEIITIISLLAAILAWIAKLRWSKEYSQAKDEIIRAKDAQIDLLKQQIENLMELHPVKLKEYYSTIKEQLEKYNDLLKEQLEAAKKEIEQKQEAINLLLNKEEENIEKISILNHEKERLEYNVKDLEGELLDIQTEMLSNQMETIQIPDFDSQKLRGIISTSNLIGNQLSSFSKKKEMYSLSESIKEKLDMIKLINNQINQGFSSTDL
jgi:chromosome segregation ATPase